MARYVTAWDYAERLEAAAKGLVRGETPLKVRELFCRPTLLVIDELHRVPQSYGDHNTQALRQLVLTRWDRRLQTVLISNDEADAFVERVGHSIVSRMNQSGRACEFRYQDLRPRISPQFAFDGFVK
ncbi:MAG: hypothetical protein QM754_12060 [Tepidisphaeraceae bacterium]